MTRLKTFILIFLLFPVALAAQQSVEQKALAEDQAGPQKPIEWFVEVINSKTKITANAFKDSKALYTTKKGTVFRVVGESGSFYNILLPNKQLAWVGKPDAVLLDPSIKVPPNMLKNALITPIREKRKPRGPYIYSNQEKFIYPRPLKRQGIDLDVQEIGRAHV